MLLVIKVPKTIANGVVEYRSVFCWGEYFECVSRYVKGLFISPNKVLQELMSIIILTLTVPVLLWGETWEPFSLEGQGVIDLVIDQKNPENMSTS